MTTKHIVLDGTFINSGYLGSNPFREGVYETRDAVGNDRTASEKLAKRYDPHPYSADYFKYDRGHITYTSVESGVLTEGLLGGNIFLFSDPGWDSNDDLRLYGKIADFVRQHDWHAGVFVGELGKTTDTLAGRTRQLTQALIAVKRGRIHHAFEILRSQPPRRGSKVLIPATWQSTWLEMRYAWRPLIKDIYDLSQAIRLLDTPRKVSMRSRVFKPYTNFRSNQPFISVRGFGRRSAVIKCTFTESRPTIPVYLGLTDPSEAAWELTPLSFVYDWFIPIGNYIRARNVLARTEMQYVRTDVNWYRVEDNGMEKGYTYSYYLNSNNWNKRSNPYAFEQRKTLVRVVGANPPSVPFPSFRNPAGSNPGTRVLDALALLKALVFSK